jgi:hypothetical protein
MQELLQESIRLINFPLTLLMGLILLYWLLAMFGAMDMHFLHFDGHTDSHMDVDAAPHGISGHLASFLHLGEAPVMVILSLLITFMWGGSMTLNHYFNEGDSILLGVVYLIPNFIVGVALTGLIAIPVSAFFSKLNDEENIKKDVIGDICKVVSRQVDEKSGQAEVTMHGAPVLINARTAGNTEFLTKGQKAVVVRKNDDGTYIIKLLEA